MSSPPSSPSSSEEVPPWEQAWKDIQPTLSSLCSTIASWPEPKARIMRVGQLDAELLDQELTATLKEPLNKALRQLGSVYEARYDPEITLIIGAILYKFSMWNNGATYGARLQDLKYKATRVSPLQSALTPSGLPQRSLLVHGCITVIVPYIHTRIRAHALSKAWPDAPSNDRKRRAWDLLTRMEAIHTTFGLIGFIVFLYDGRYRTIADRLLGLKLVPSRSIARRSVSYEFMNRQMVWHAFTEFLIFVTPLINARKVRRRLTRFFSKATDPSALLPASVLARLPRAGSPSPSAGDPPAAASQEGRRGKYWALSSDQCAICAENASYDIAHLSAAADSTARTLAAETSSNSSAHGYTPISWYAVRGSRPHHASKSHGVNSLGGANTTTDEDLVDADAVPDANMPPPFPITTPYRASCGHAYCYFCLAEKMIHFSVGNDNDEDDEYWECLRCEQRVTSAERVLGVDGGRDEDDSLDALSDVDRDVGAEAMHK